MENKKSSLESFHCSILEYEELDDGSFAHNFDQDLHLFLLWEKGRSKENQVIEHIRKDYNILYCVEIKWSRENSEANLNRLYRNEITKKNQKLETVGRGPFLCIIVEDKDPCYGFAQSLDGTISMSNLNIVRYKALFKGAAGR